MKPTPPKKWKVAVVAWLSIYPLITCLIWLFGSWFNAIQPLPLRMAVITLIVVPLMVYVMVPLWQSVLKEWLK